MRNCHFWGNCGAIATKSARHLSTFFVLVISLVANSGCSYNAAVKRPRTAPRLPASSSVTVVAERPATGIHLGTVTIRGNSWTSASGCESEAALQTKRLGATHVVVRPSGKGNQCTAQAYVLGDKVTAVDPSEGKSVGVSKWRYAASVLLVAAGAGVVGYLVGGAVQ
jgi:hypothetical protein